MVRVKGRVYLGKYPITEILNYIYSYDQLFDVKLVMSTKHPDYFSADDKL